MGPRTLTAAAGGAMAMLLCLALLPAFVAYGTVDTQDLCGVDVEAVAATIRELESGGDYTARARGSSASGAYQFTDATWARHGGYQSAYLAPPEVQDAKAHDHIGGILANHGGDVAAVPVVWYIGHLPDADSAVWDRVPAPGAGNQLTPRQYQEKWLQRYHTLTAPPGEFGATDPEASGRCGPAESGELLPGGWALLGPRELIDATADQFNKAHHDYPAWDWRIPIGTPIYAIRSGTVTSVSTTAHNCRGSSSCQRCGLGATITDEEGARWTYCHGSALHVGPGQSVDAGQRILASGNSGNSTGPHLHLSIRVDGVLRCPQPLLVDLHHGRQLHGVAELPRHGCTS